jgi:peptidoglycan-associated lipoprotein
MKLMKFTNLILLGTLLTLPFVGCKKKPTGLTPLPNYGKTGGPGDIGPGKVLEGEGTAKPEDLKGIVSNPANSHQGWLENATMFQSDIVHFDFDSSVVKAGEKPKVAKVADYLKGSAADALRVEGHCDERGTEEYNRALGERRALALREELVRLGIDPTRVDTISYGEDRPADPGHNEAAWRKNRRGEFILLSPPK